MAKRGNRPRDAEDTKGGVRGTHGHGDLPREREKRDRKIATRTANWDRSARPTASPRASDEAERDVAMSGALEAVQPTGAESVPSDADTRAQEVDEEALDAQERKERNLASKIVPGPGPKDRHAGRATEQHLETHDLDDEIED